MQIDQILETLLKTLETLLKSEDNLINRALLLTFSIFAPIGIIYLFFQDEISNLETYRFVLLIFGFSPFLLSLYIRNHFKQVDIIQQGITSLSSIIKKREELDKKIKETTKKTIENFKEFKSFLETTDREYLISNQSYFQLMEKKEKEISELAVERENMSKILQDNIGILEEILEKAKNIYFIKILLDFIYHFLIVFLIMISINLFLVKISFLLFIFSILVIFILITVMDTQCLKLRLYLFRKKSNVSVKKLEQSLKISEIYFEFLQSYLEKIKSRPPEK